MDPHQDTVRSFFVISYLVLILYSGLVSLEALVHHIGH
jgi:hypothetical protein